MFSPNFGLGFEKPHNFVRHFGVANNPLKRKIPQWKKQLWLQGKYLYFLLNNHFASGEFVIYVSLMTSNDQSVKWHSNERNITFQIVIFLGTFVGESFFEFEDPTGAYTIRIPIIPGTIIVFDGHLRHRKIAMESFHGEQYTVIFFKNYD